MKRFSFFVYSLYICFITIIPQLAIGQSKSIGIEFTQAVTWQKIRQKAIDEDKFIFVDCYATWCKPCKEMDLHVYSNIEVGLAMNDKFVSIKVQMDSAKKDDDFIKLSYPLARQFEKDYEINELPTYLFFSPKGELVHKGIGGKSTKSFLELVKEAVNPDRQIFTTIARWRQGRLPNEEIPKFANRLFNEFREKKIAKEMVNDYVQNYLYKLSDSSFLKKDNILFIISYGEMIKTNDKIFLYCYNQPNLINIIFDDFNFSNRIVNYVLFKEYVIPELNYADRNKNNPDWRKIKRQFYRDKINKTFAKLNVINGKIRWYNEKKNWRKYVLFLDKQMDLDGYSSGDWGSLNSAAWEVFEHSFNKRVLRHALKWSEKSISEAALHAKERVPHLLDTKANILYKLGRRNEAIELYQKILTMAPSNKSYRETLNLMKNGEKTWLQEDN